MFKIVFRDSSLDPKQLYLFCLLRLISASADRIGCSSDFQPLFRGKLVFRERSSGVPQEI